MDRSGANEDTYPMLVISRLITVTYLHLRFLSNLHDTGFSSCWITIMIHSYLVWFLWWLRHGAIGPCEATSFVGLMSTDLTSEFTHFNLVIRLSKVQQLALPFCTFLWSPASPAVPWDPLWNAYFTERSRAEHPETSSSCSSLQRHSIISWTRNQAGTRLSGVVSSFLVVWWGETFCAPNSLELESRLLPIGARIDHGPGAGNNRTTSK